MILKLALPFFFLFIQNASAQTYCEHFSSVQLKQNYNANFMNKEMRGCFTNFFNLDSQPGKATKVIGSFTIEIGKNVKSIESPTNAKVAYSAFSGLAVYRETSRQLGDNADAALQAIRFQSKESAIKITNEIVEFKKTYQQDAETSIKYNADQIKKESDEFHRVIREQEEQLKKLAVTQRGILHELPAIEDATKSTNPVNREQERWIGANNSQNIPFHIIEKIYKQNPEFALKILNEVKAARYMGKNLIASKDLPLLHDLQNLDKKNKNFIFKYSNLQKNFSANDTYYEQKKLVFQAGYELNKIAEQKTIEGDFNKAHDGFDMATLALDMATSLPIAATGRGLYEFISGRSLLTNRELSNFERGAALSMAIIDLTPQAWLANGVRGVWLLGELSAKLAAKGIIKAGFENALAVGIENAKLFSSTLNRLVSQQLIKVETAKRIIEHRLFFNFLPEESYILKGGLEKNAIELEKTLKRLGSGVDNQTVEQEIFSANKIKYTGDGAFLKTAEEVNDELSTYYSQPPFKKGDTVIENTIKDGEELVRFYKEGVTNPVGYWVARAKDVEGLTALEIQQKYALPILPDSFATVKLPPGTKVYEGIVETFLMENGKKLEGGGWQIYIKQPLGTQLSSDWFMPTNITLK